MQCPDCAEALYDSGHGHPDCPGDGLGCPSCGWGCDLDFFTDGDCAALESDDPDGVV